MSGRGRWYEAWARGPLALDAMGDTGVVGEARVEDLRPAAFLDRDGVLNEGVADPESGLAESPLRVEDVRLLPGVAAALGALARAGYALVCVSNQPAAAKGKASVDDLLAIHERVLELLAREGVELDRSLLCPHHPDGVIAELSGTCDCRKPAPGMLLDAARELGLDCAASWMLGDTDTDVQAGHAAGCRAALIEYPASAHKRSPHASPAPDCSPAIPELRAVDLGDAVAPLLDRSRLRPRLSS